MGAQFARDLAEAGRVGEIQAEVALLQHLQYNHYPPLPASLLEPAKQAIAAIEAGTPEAEIELPAGILWRGRPTCPASACVDGWHLEAFVDPGTWEE